MDCTNDKPCGKATRGPHSVVCVKATAQGLVARAAPSARSKLDPPPAQAQGASTAPHGCGCGAFLLPGEEDLVQGVMVHRWGKPCIRLEPERAGREGDQALPEAGAASVFAEVRRRLDEREATGVRRYGRSLETFNGRDACRDLEDELLDGLAYATQVRLEQAAIVEALLALASVVSTEVEVSKLVPSWAEKTRAALALAEKLEAARGR